MAHRAHRLGGHRGQVGHPRAGLVEVDLLQRQHVGVELPDGGDEPVQFDAAVVDAASVQDVEGGHPMHGYYVPTMTVSDDRARNDDLRDALKRAASALKAHGPEFALAGSYALWVYGGPEPVHDVDFVVAEADTEAAALTLEKAGFHIERTPEDWLFKACVGDVVIDVLHQLNGKPVDAATIRGAEELDVLAIRMRVLSPTHVMTEKLNSLNEHHCDFASLLPASARCASKWTGTGCERTPPTTTSPWRFCCSPTGWGSRPNPPRGAAARRPSRPPDHLRRLRAPRSRSPAARVEHHPFGVVGARGDDAGVGTVRLDSHRCR